jgi:signal transduction histidine kinase
METVWWRRGLDQRLGSLTGAAIVLWTLGTAVAASIATAGIADAITADRQTRAQAIASRLDRTLDEAFRHLDRVAAASAAASPQLDTQVRSLALAESVVRVSPIGDMLWTRDVVDGRETRPVIESLPARYAERHINATGIIQTTRGPRVVLVVPARESDAVGGVVGAVLNVDHGPIRTVLDSYANEAYRVALLDADGREIAASRPPPGNGHRDWPPGAFLLAHAAVSNGVWQLELSQPREEALAPVFRLRRVLVGSTLLLIPFAILVAAVTARSIRGPVLAMTAAAERLARGDFTAVVPPAGEDEIGRLADALEQLRKALEADDRRSRLLKRVISAQEEERRRIARELHDETTQQLTVLAMQLGLANADDAHTQELLARSRALVATMIDDVHRVIYDLRPSMLDDLGLLPAVRAYAEKRLGRTGIDVNCEFPPAMPPLSPEVTTALYRVAQEALTNIARHARATAVLIACTLNDAHVVLEIEDDGVGFVPARVSQPRETGEGLGLLGMRERLALLGGRLEIESEPGRGTRVIAMAPLALAQGAHEAHEDHEDHEDHIGLDKEPVHVP